MFTDSYVNGMNRVKRRSQSMNYYNNNKYFDNKFYNMKKSVYPSPNNHAINLRDRRTIFDQLIEKQYKKYPNQHRSLFEQKKLDRSLGLREREQDIYSNQRSNSSQSARNSRYRRKIEDNQFEIYQETFLLQQQYQQDQENKKHTLKLQVQKKLQQIKQKIKQAQKLKELRDLKESAESQQQIHSPQKTSPNQLEVKQLYIQNSPNRQMYELLQNDNQALQSKNISKSQFSLSTTEHINDHQVKQLNNMNNKNKKRMISIQQAQQIDKDHSILQSSIAEQNANLNQEIKNILIDFKGVQQSQYKLQEQLPVIAQPSPKIAQVITQTDSPQQKQKQKVIISPINKKCQVKDRTLQFEIEVPSPNNVLTKQSHDFTQQQYDLYQQQQNNTVQKQSVRFNLSDLAISSSKPIIQDQQSDGIKLKLDDIDKSYSSIDNYRYQDEALSSDYEDILTQETKTNVNEGEQFGVQIDSIMKQKQDVQVNNNHQIIQNTKQNYHNALNAYHSSNNYNQINQESDNTKHKYVYNFNINSKRIQQSEQTKQQPRTTGKQNANYNDIIKELSKKYLVNSDEDESDDHDDNKQFKTSSDQLQSRIRTRLEKRIQNHNKFLQQDIDDQRITKNKLLLQKLSDIRKELRKEHQREQNHINQEQESVWKMIQNIRDKQFQQYQEDQQLFFKQISPESNSASLQQRWDNQFKQKLQQLQINQNNYEHAVNYEITQNSVQSGQRFKLNEFANQLNTLNTNKAMQVQNKIINNIHTGTLKLSNIHQNQNKVDETESDLQLNKTQKKISELFMKLNGSKAAQQNEQYEIQQNIQYKYNDQQDNFNNEDSDNYGGDLYNDDSKSNSPQKQPLHR